MNIKDLGSGMDWFKWLLSAAKEYSIFDFLKTCMLVFMMSVTIRVCYNPEFIFKKYIEFVREYHTIETSARETHDEAVNRMLPVMLYKYHADRVYIVQYHNGVSDWKYGSMRFEYCATGVKSVKTSYDHVHLSWLSLPLYLKNHELYIGTIEDFANIDKTLYEWYSQHGTKYVACVLLRDNSGAPSGILGFMWNKEIPLEDIEEKMISYMYEDRAALAPHTQNNIINAEIK